MKPLKKTISKYMYQVTAISLIFMLFAVLYAQLVTEQKRAYENSVQTFRLIENRLEENEQELRMVEEEYKQTCLYNAEVIAGIIEENPDIMEDLEGLRELAVLLEVDEISENPVHHADFMAVSDSDCFRIGLYGDKAPE